MGSWIGRHPQAASLVAALALLAGAAALALPRLDAIEIRSARIVAGAPGAGPAVEVRLGFRLASAPAGIVRVRLAPRAHDPGGPPAEERLEVLEGSGERTVRLPVADAEPRPVLAELEPGGSGTGWLDRLQQARRRDVRLASAPEGRS